jgi:hypothetical protein
MVEDRAPRARFATDQLVVATQYENLVLRELEEPRHPVTNAQVTDSDDRLGLSLINVTHAAGADEGAVLDRLLKDLYERFHEQYDRWVPTIGKNRLLERIDGASGYVGGGDAEGASGYVGGGHAEGVADRETGSGSVDTESGYVGGGGGGLPTKATAADIPKSHTGKGGRSVRVAILDTRLYPHPDLAGRYITEDRDTLLPDPNGVLYHAGHATFVAGLVIQRAPQVVLDVHNALNDKGEATAWDVARKMVEFADAGVSILNLSLGCFTVDGAPPLLFQRAVELLTPEVVIIAAAGNHGDGNVPYNVGPKTPFWPAALDDVVAVGAHDSSTGQRAPFSPDAPWVTLSAPGVNVASTYLRGKVEVEAPDKKGKPSCHEYGGYARWSGTSFAAAAVTGDIAANTQPHPSGSREALAKLRDQSRPGVDIWAYDHSE